MKAPILISILMLGFSNAVAAEAVGKTRSPRGAEPKPLASKSSGPTGYGPIKLGMSKQAVEALPIDAEISLADSLVEYKPTKPEPQGVLIYRTKLGTPMRPLPYDLSLTFKDNRLTRITLELDDGGFAQASEQISSKYGPGVTSNSRKEERCIYGNGANFTVSSGPINTTWIEALTTGEKSETALLDMVVDVCPSNLRYAVIAPMKYKALSISLVPIQTTPKPANPF